MKITLIIILMNLQFSYSTSNTSSPQTFGSGAGGTLVCANSTCSTTPAYKKITIPMPDLKSCLEARHQVDDYSMLISAACSAE